MPVEGEIFLHPSTPVLWPNQPLVQREPSLLPGGKAAEAWHWPSFPYTAEVAPSLDLHGLLHGRLAFIFYSIKELQQNKVTIWDLAFSHLYCWKFKSSGKSLSAVVKVLTLNKQALRPFDTSGTTYPTKKPRISEGLCLQYPPLWYQFLWNLSSN